MKRLIEHYIREKTAYAPLPCGLADKMARLDRAFSHLREDASGAEIIVAAKAAWPNVKDGTIRRYLVQLRAVLRMAAADDLIRKAPRIQLPYVYDAIDIDIDTAGVVALLRWVRFNEPGWYVLTTLLAHTGARLSEALRLDAGSFKPNGITISKMADRRTKTIARVVPYTSRTREIAEGLAARESWVANEDGSLRLRPSDIATQSVSTCLGRVVDRGVQELGLNPLRVHDLRHCMAVLIAEAGGDLSDIASVLGHSSVSMSARYRGMVPARASGIMRAMT